MYIKTSLNCTSQFWNKFIQATNLKNDENEEIVFANYFNKYTSELIPKIKQSDVDVIIIGSEKDIKLNDIVDVVYLPYSQKYMEYCDSQAACGKIFYIDEENGNGLMYYDDINSSTRFVKTIEIGNLSFSGLSKGYDILFNILIL